jgi:hypothetical protein
VAERYRTEGVSPDSPALSVEPVGGDYDADRDAGWMVFAGTMIGIVGVLNTIYGIAAISDSDFFARDVDYIVSGLNTYGWVLLIVGVVQMCAAAGIWAFSQWARWLGVLTAGVNAIIQLLFIPASPFLALGIFAVDILVIYGLVVHGGRRYHTA